MCAEVDLLRMISFVVTVNRLLALPFIRWCASECAGWRRCVWCVCGGCQAREAAKKQRLEMVGLPQEQISRIRKPQKPSSPDPPETPPPSCPGCGRSPHSEGRRHCPAYNLTCHHCQKLGHTHELTRVWNYLELSGTNDSCHHCEFHHQTSLH